MPINRQAIRSFYDAVALNRETWGSHGLPRASSVGADLRQQWFELMHQKYPDDPRFMPLPLAGERYWLMDEGKWQEEYVYDVLRAQGYSVYGIQAAALRYLDIASKTVKAHVVPDESYLGLEVSRMKRLRRADREGQRVLGDVVPLTTMHIDGIIEGGPDNLPPTLLELKKLTMYAFSGLVQHEVFHEKLVYYMQAQICADSMRQKYGVQGIRMMVFSRDPSAVNWHFRVQRSKNPIDENPGLYVEDMRLDPQSVTLADFRARHVVDCLEREEPPIADLGIDIRHAKILKSGETVRTFPCAYCDYLNACLQQYFREGLNINELIITDDARTKKEKEDAARTTGSS